MELPTLGSSAPAFSLLNQADEKISLADFKGKKNVLLYFYPKAMTPGCTVQACGIRDSEEAFAALDTVVLAVSPDAPARLAKFQDKEALNFTLLSDEDHAVTEAYGAWGLKKFMGREYMGVFRYTFIIDKHGDIVQIMDKVKTKTHHEDSLHWIQENL